MEGATINHSDSLPSHTLIITKAPGGATIANAMTQEQCTLASSLTFEGTGLHTGQHIRILVEPAGVNHGITLRRGDLEGTQEFPAHWSQVSRANALNTTVGTGNATISTVEHLLSALRALGIDNASITAHGPEIPILDGSSLPFCEGIRKAGRIPQGEKRVLGRLESPVYLSQGEITIVAIPADELRLSYTLCYPEHPLLHAQFHTQVISEDEYLLKCAPCRTFTLAQDIEALRSRGLILGGGLHNAVVVDGPRILNPEGLRLPQEMARHKVLDMLGDFSLVGGFFHAHIMAVRSGHATHVAFAKELSAALKWS